MSLEKVSREDITIGGLALLLLIDLVALPWFTISFGPFSSDLTMTDGPDGWLGVLAVLALIALLADLAIERFSPSTQLPAIGSGRAFTRFILAASAAGFIALKFLFHIHFSLFGFGFYAGVVVAAALVYFAMQASNA